MMRIAYLAIAVLLLAATMAGAANTTTYSFTAYVGPSGAGENWISVPGVPLSPEPDAVFGSVADFYALSALDPVTQNMIGWASWEPNFNILLGEGYTLTVDGADAPFSFDGIADGVPNEEGQKTDMWISLPGSSMVDGAEHWVGCPYDTVVDLETILVTDGTKTIPLLSWNENDETAVSLGWISDSWYYLDAASQNLFYTDIYWVGGEPTLQPWHMYKVTTYKENIALIIPAPAAAAM